MKTHAHEKPNFSAKESSFSSGLDDTQVYVEENKQERTLKIEIEEVLSIKEETERVPEDNQDVCEIVEIELESELKEEVIKTEVNDKAYLCNHI